MLKFIIEFLVFLKDNKAHTIIMASIISTYWLEFINSFTDDIIIPILNFDLNKDGKADLKSIKDFKIKTFGVELKIGNLIYTLIKTSFILCIIFLLRNKILNLDESIDKKI